MRKKECTVRKIASQHIDHVFMECSRINIGGILYLYKYKVNI